MGLKLFLTLSPLEPPAPPTGKIKSQAFLILERKMLNGTTLNVRSAPTPACTASLAIAQEVVEMAAKDFDWGEGNVRKNKDSPFYD